MADLLGGVPGIVVGVGVGAAASAALEPAIELPKQTAWQDNPNKILDAATIARLVAQGGIDLGSAHRSGLRDGYSPDKIDALVYLSQTVPGFAEGLTLWRLGLIDQSLFTHVLTKAGMDQRYVGPIVNSKTAVPLSPQIVALAIQRGLVDDQGILPVPPPTATGKVPAFPVFPIDATAESAKSGLDKERLSVLVGNSGLSMGLVQAAQAFFRQIIELPDYYRAVAEGDTRNEWRDAILDVSRQILTADQYLEGALRGWTTLAEGKAGAAKHGMSDADSQLLYEIRRRPLTPHTITEALAKGGKFQPAANEIQDPYDAAVHQQDLGPEWYDLAKAMKYSPPSLFVIRQLLKDGVYTVAHATLRMEQLGLFPDDAALIAQAYAPTGGAAADPHVTKAENQLWTTTHRSYVGEMIDDPTATAALTAAGVGAGSVPQVLSLWGEERSLIRKQLSPAQVHKAVKEGVTNPATGQPWTQQDGIQALLARGYAQADAVTLLEE